MDEFLGEFGKKNAAEEGSDQPAWEAKQSRTHLVFSTATLPSFGQTEYTLQS